LPRPYICIRWRRSDFDGWSGGGYHGADPGHNAFQISSARGDYVVRLYICGVA
jgi:hypothetical protein